MFHRLLQGVTARLKSMPTSELLEAVSSVSLPEEIDIEELHVSKLTTYHPLYARLLSPKTGFLKHMALPTRIIIFIDCKPLKPAIEEYDIINSNIKI